MGTRVIIADDHAIIREGLKSLLEKKGMDVIAIAKNGPPDRTKPADSSSTSVGSSLLLLLIG